MRVKKFNELNENNKLDDVFNKKNYSNEFTIEIESLKNSMLRVLQKWSKENNYIPTKKTIDSILYDYYNWILYPETDGLYEYINAFGEEMDYLDSISNIIEKKEPEKFKRYKKLNNFNI